MSQANTQEDSLQFKDAGKILMEWEFPEFVKYDRTKLWYIIATVIAGLFLLYAVYAHNFLLAVIVIMVIMLILVRERTDPRHLKFALTDTGIMIGEKVYHYREIKNFSVIYDPPQTKILYLEFKSKIKPRFSIDFKDHNPHDIRKILKEYVEENLDREGETFGDALGRWLKL